MQQFTATQVTAAFRKLGLVGPLLAAGPQSLLTSPTETRTRRRVAWCSLTRGWGNSVICLGAKNLVGALAALLVGATVAHAQVAVYTDRTSWESAVAVAGSTAQNYDFSGLDLVFPDTTGVNRVTQLDTNYDNRFRIVVDRLASSVFSNPGLDLFPDASCSLGSGDCEVFTFNVVDPDQSLNLGPRVNRLIMPTPLVAFGGDFIQAGFTAGGTPTATGVITLTFGSDTVVVNDFLPSPGNGFLGFVAQVPSDMMSFTFEQSGTITNDIFNIYNPAFGVAPEGEDPADMISDLSNYALSLNLQDGISTSLASQLGGALGFVTANDLPGACSKLADFINHVRAQRGKKIPIAQANTLIADATEIRATLACG